MSLNKKIATIILNRNLPDATNNLVEYIKKNDRYHLTDIFVVEAGSDNYNLSKYCSWHIKDKETIKNGLRYYRGMNCGLSKLWFEDKFLNYDFFFLLTNDTEIESTNHLEKMIEIMGNHNKLGLLSPCSKDWGEKQLLTDVNIKYFWYIHNTAYFIRRELIEKIATFDEHSYINGLFDGSNFRGYGADSELIGKAYVNDYACGITNEVWAFENNSYLIDQSDLIRTDNYNKNLDLWLNEGKQWMRLQYGFNNKWDLNFYTKNLYDNFFKLNSSLNKYKI